MSRTVEMTDMYPHVNENAMPPAILKRPELPQDDEARWQAMLARDARYDGMFVCAVRSTGIYCRPSCPARKPRRENVSFFPDCDAAERAGFRACLRCRPRALPRQAELAERACRLIDAHLTNGDQPPTLSALGEALEISPTHLQRSFKQVIGISPRQYAAAHRLARVKARLRDGEEVTSALYDAGYGSSSRLYEQATGRLGMTPGTYRRGGQGMRIGYTIVDSPLGRLLVGATDAGVCAVCLGDDDTALEAALRAEYPAAEIRRDGAGEAGSAGWVQAVVDHLSGRRSRLDLPLDVQATAFQWRVWEALRAIPMGETRSYGEVARAIGEPKAARAVAHACATNPVALVIPCHRVVRANGRPGGYRWGSARKEALLRQEQEQAASVAT